MRALHRGLVAGAFCAALSAALPAFAVPAPPSAPDGQVTNVQTQQGTVQFLLSVGNLPNGATLNPASVVVTADGDTLKATATDGGTKSAAKAPPLRETVLVLDVSGSMQGDGISAARSAALTYAQSLPKDVRIGLVTFSQKPTVLLRPTADRSALAAAVSKVAAGGSTALYDGVLAAADLLKGLPSDAERRLLVLSDGDDTASKHALADAGKALAADKVAADVVAFRLPGSDRAALTTIANDSHGKVIAAAQAGDLASIFTQAASEFRQQVLVTASVPARLAEKHVTLTATINAGSESVTASTSLTLPDAVPVKGQPRQVSAPAAASSTSNVTLWVTVGLAFGAFLVIVLAALFVPVLRAAEADKRARLVEMNRYRVLGVVGAAETTTLSGSEGRPGMQTAIAQRALSVVDRTVRARGQRDRLVAELERAGLRMRPEEWAVIQLAVVLGLGVVLLVVTGSIIGLIIGAAIGWIGARMFIKTKVSRRQAAFMDQLPDTLQLLASSLRTGFSLNQALGGVVREGTEPTASEFARALTEVRIGADLEGAMDGVATRMRCQDLAWVVMAVRISREVGGNLAEVLGTTVQTMRARAELRRQVRVLTAEGRVSARILTALPFFVGAALALLRPGYLKPLFTQAPGIAMLCAGAVLLALGSFWLSRLVKIKV
jgi:tight adherence protein B